MVHVDKLVTVMAVRQREWRLLRALDTLARTHHATIATKVTLDWPTHAIDGAARLNSLEMVTYMHAQGATASVLSMQEAATSGNLRFLVETLHLRGAAYMMAYAASNGHVPIVQYLDTQPWSLCGSSGMDDAASLGHLDIVKYLHFH